jgi:hypothetical protein
LLPKPPPILSCSESGSCAGKPCHVATPFGARSAPGCRCRCQAAGRLKSAIIRTSRVAPGGSAGDDVPGITIVGLGERAVGAASSPPPIAGWPGCRVSHPCRRGSRASSSSACAR